MRKLVRRVAPFLLLIVVACATMPQSFNEKLGYGYGTVTEVREVATTLLEADVITAQDAENVQAQADNFRAGLDIARSMRDDPQADADSKLEAVIAGLKGLQTYLKEKQ